MARIEKTVFISYRRTNLPWALCIYQNLTANGYDVFFDYLSIDSGSFEKVILENIKSRAHFVLILTPSALERCKNPNDWLRREIETAIDEKRNIIPLMIEGFDFGSPYAQETLTGKLGKISGINALTIHNDYALEGMERLRTRFLNVALEDINLPKLTQEAEKVAETQQAAASEAEPVQEEQLTAQTWFERGYSSIQNKNLEEAFRCYSESIKLDPNFLGAHNNLGVILDDLGRFTEAESYYRKAIELYPNNAASYNNLAILLCVRLKRYEEAESFYRKAIEIDPIYAIAYSNLANLLFKQKRYEESEKLYRKSIEIDNTSYNAHSDLGGVLLTLKRYEEAESVYRKAIELNSADADNYYNLGIILDNLKRYDEAETCFHKSIEINPLNNDGYIRLFIALNRVRKILVRKRK